MKQCLPLVFLLLPLAAVGQGASVSGQPADIAPRVLAQPHELIRRIQFLQDAPANKEVAKRRRAIAFLKSWINRSAEVNPVIADKLRAYLTYGEAESIFLGGYTQFFLSHPTTDHAGASVAGMYSVVAYYKDNKHILGFDVLLQKLVDLQKNGRFRGFIQRRVD